MEEKIMVQHPQGKKGVSIAKRRYDMIKDCLLPKIEKYGEVTFNQLCDECVEELTGKFDGKILWYTEWVKLDLEAKGIIERISKTTPHKVRMKK